MEGNIEAIDIVGEKSVDKCSTIGALNLILTFFISICTYFINF